MYFYSRRRMKDMPMLSKSWWKPYTERKHCNKMIWSHRRFMNFFYLWMPVHIISQLCIIFCNIACSSIQMVNKMTSHTFIIKYIHFNFIKHYMKLKVYNTLFKILFIVITHLRANSTITTNTYIHPNNDQTISLQQRCIQNLIPYSLIVSLSYT